MPEAGLTFGETWAKYGMCIDGGPVPDGAVPLADSDGYVVEFSGETPQIDLPVSRWIFLSTSVQRNFTFFTLIYTGAPADLNAQFEIDGQLLTVVQRPTSLTATSFWLKGKGEWNETGRHTLKTWRTLDGKLIDGSDMVFEYYVAEGLSV